MSASGASSLAGADLERALAALERVGSFRRGLFCALQVVAYTLPPLIALHLIADIAYEFVQWHGLAGALLSALVDLSMLIPPLILGLLILLALNARLFWLAYRQRLLAKKLEAVALVEGLRESKRRHLWKARQALFLATPALLLLLALWREAFGSSTEPHWRVRLAVYLVSFGFAFLVFFFDLILERLRIRAEHFKRVGNLRRELRRAGGDTPDSALTRRLAALETLTDLERQAAAKVDSARRGHGYAIARSAGFREAARELGTERRARLEGTILKLRRRPTLWATRSAPRGRWLRRVRGTDLEIAYSVDAGAGRIELHELRTIESG